MDENIRRTRLESKYTFINRSTGSKKLCYMLAGFKEFLWPMVFERLERFIPKDIDVCILSAGVYKEELAAICERNHWSYLHNEERDIGRIQNICLSLFTEAELIYKMDEDMFVTEHSFEEVLKTYQRASERWEVSFAAPLIPVNGYGYVPLLERLGKIEDYENLFGPVRYTFNDNYTKQKFVSKIWDSVEACQFMWREIELDKINRVLQQDPFKYSICPILFNIGFILFEKKLWEDMDYFWTYEGHPGVGGDEEWLCKFTKDYYKAIAVSENAVVGHFAYHPQEVSGEMKQFFLENPEVFELK